MGGYIESLIRTTVAPKHFIQIIDGRRAHGIHDEKSVLGSYLRESAVLAPIYRVSYGQYAQHTASRILSSLSPRENPIVFLLFVILDIYTCPQPLRIPPRQHDRHNLRLDQPQRQRPKHPTVTTPL
jgi:hypothetical protein